MVTITLVLHGPQRQSNEEIYQRTLIWHGQLGASNSQLFINVTLDQPTMMWTSIISSPTKNRVKVAALASLLILVGQSRAFADNADSAVTILDVSPSHYLPTPGAPSLASDVNECKAWSLDKQQVASVFRLSTELREGALHDYYWLPCSIKGHARFQEATWEFEINAAGISTWRNGDATRSMGCSQIACQSLIILMPDSDR